MPLNLVKRLWNFDLNSEDVEKVWMGNPECWDEIHDLLWSRQTL